MKAVVQRVKNAGVTVDGEVISRIDKGYMILLGVMDDDTAEDIDILAKKIASLRVFEDENGKMNLDIKNVDGEILAISQFTLCADVKKGVFGADMKVDLVNDGPVTIVYDTEIWVKRC